MRFGRRRSSLAAEPVQTEPDLRRRNRLSKPLTATATKLQVPTSPSALSLQVLPQSKNASATDLAPESPLSVISANALRLQIRNEVLGPDIDSHSPNHTMKNNSSWSVAYLIGQIEGSKLTAEAPPKQLQQEETMPLSPVRPQKRKSLLLRRLSLHRSSSLIRTPSSERVDSLKSDGAATYTPNASLDQVVISPSIPPTRRSSFTPGAATRKLHAVASDQDMYEHKVIEEVEEPEPSEVETEYFDWQPPQPRTIGRAGTPSDMGYSQLGGLRHGSLQVVNGRASPAFSEASKVSKYLLAVQPLPRYVSSEYGDAEEDFEPDADPELFADLHDMAQHRFVSWDKDDDRSAPRTHPLQNFMRAQEETEALSDKDHTSVIAQEYISELGNSPFELQRPDSPVGTIRRTRSEGSLWRASSCSSLRSSRSAERALGELSPVSPLDRSPSPSGSVVRKTSAEFTSERGFLQVATDKENRPCESTVSWYSPTEPTIPVDEAFQSAIEFQVQLSSSKVGLQLPRAPEKSDSGYSSSNSLRSFQITKQTLPPVEVEALPEIPDSVMINSTPQPSRPALFLGLRPSIIKSRKTEPDVLAFASLRYSATSSNAAPVAKVLAASDIGSEVDAPKSTKARKKLLKKRRPLNQPPGQISVVRVQSFEEENIPQISHEARENLRIRSHAVPELEQTYVRSSMSGNQLDSSNLDVSMTEIRFPSPAPEQPKPSRSRSRPRSWFGRTKSDVPSSRHNSGISQADAMAIINDFGTDGAVLGRNNYDLSVQGIVSPRSRASSIVSKAPSYPRSMMDDETATQLARRRSRSLHERGATVSDRRPSFNDRGGVPGKTYRPASFISDPPPITAEMLEKAYRTSSMQRQASFSTDVAPPPPPHSPRPFYIDHEEDQYEPVAPPPPSHSPRPVDISPDPWAAQAAAWQARRKSAGAALKRQSFDSRKYEQHGGEVEHELLYPAIPPRQQPGWTECISAKEYSTYPQDSHQQDVVRLARQQTRYALCGESYDHQNEQESAYARQSRRNSEAHDVQLTGTKSRGSPRRRPLPSPRPSVGAVPSRPRSNANSVRSFGASIAEEQRAQDYQRSHPPPTFGRYSGGLGFGYERGNGVGGSAGTRSASGRTDASRKGVALRASLGVDLGDVPVGIMV